MFVDGLGLGESRVGNPLVDYPTPALEELLGGPLTRDRARAGNELVLTAIDATLGVDGLPQSATGQTSLFTGVNAARWMGRHVAAFPGPQLRSLLAEHSVHKRARSAGCRVLFANAFSGDYFAEMRRRRRRPSATVVAAWSAALDLLTVDDLIRRRALSWDLKRDHLSSALGRQLPLLEAAEAGADLARLASEHELTIYETFLPDLAGHRRYGLDPGEVVKRLDGLLAGLLANLTDNVTLVLTSDHGNFEESEHKRHTRNPVPLLAVGPQAELFGDTETLCGVTPKILQALGIAA